LLVDTWWYGLTRRLTAADFQALAELRVDQGFSAVQLVVGIPPEVGPANPNAASTVGPAWNLAGQLNHRYLQLAAQRITILNDFGLRVIVYGAWGQQISWLGRPKMVSWWQEIVNYLDDLDVIYCLTGESNLFIGQEDILLPDRSTMALGRSKIRGRLPPKLIGPARKIIQRWRQRRPQQNLSQKHQRQENWSYVLEALAQMTARPIIIHTNAGETGWQVVSNRQYLAANTTQTGHSQTTRNALWQIPLRELKDNPQQIFINLEPWYEGISDNFYRADQLYAYWVSMLAGAASCCYGAHGIWNVGDGRFLAHWGKQTFEQAKLLDTPRLLGRSHAQFLACQNLQQTALETRDGQLIAISRRGPDQAVTFYPEIATVAQTPQGKLWLPLEGRYTAALPASGPLVIFH
jgi:hypothetical protein